MVRRGGVLEEEVVCGFFELVDTEEAFEHEASFASLLVSFQEPAAWADLRG